MSQTFQRKIEDFTCEHCGTKVAGNGYTNHCPNCLWSKHVDINPGDRAAACGGMMEPVKIEKTPDGYRITHRCQVCHTERINKLLETDNFEAALQIAEQLN